MTYFFLKIAISSVSESGTQPWYLEECAGTLASAYSSGGGNGDHSIVNYLSLIFFYYFRFLINKDYYGFTSWLYKFSFWNISSSTISCSNLCSCSRSKVFIFIFLLLIFKNFLFSPDLTWRDVMYITVLGSRAHAIPSNTQIFRNAAGFNGKIISFFLLYLNIFIFSK